MTSLVVGCAGPTSTRDGGIDAGVGADGGPSSANTVSGTIGGQAFGPVLTAWMIGQPDGSASGATSTAIYLFNGAFDCHDVAVQFGQMGWDSNLPDQTQFLELKMFGSTRPTTPPTMPGDYAVTGSLTPAPGEASCNRSLTHGSSGSSELSARGGRVTITRIVDKTSIEGTFTLNFPNNDTLTGSFSGGYCDVGVEP